MNTQSNKQKDNFDDYVIVSQYDNSLESPDVIKHRVMILVGYKVLDADLYFVQKFGNVGILSKEAIGNKSDIVPDMINHLKEKIKRIWNEIKSQKEWTYSISLYAYHLGAEYEMDDDFNVVGEWKQVGEITIKCDKVFLSKDGNPPKELQHLRRAQFPQLPTIKSQNF